MTTSDSRRRWFEAERFDQVEHFSAVELGGLAGLRAEVTVDLQGDQAVHAAPDAEREGKGRGRKVGEGGS